MSTPLPNPGNLLPPEGIQALVADKRGRRPGRQEQLAQAAVQAVMQLTRKKRAAEVLSPEVLELVAHMLGSLRRPPWKPDTALILRRRQRRDGGA